MKFVPRFCPPRLLRHVHGSQWRKAAGGDVNPTASAGTDATRPAQAPIRSWATRLHLRRRAER